MYVGFAALVLSMLTLSPNCYCSPTISSYYGDDATLSYNVTTDIESYSGNNQIHVYCYDIRPITDYYATIGTYPMLTYLFTIADNSTTQDFVLQFEFGGNNFDTIQVTTYAKTFNGSLGPVTYDNTFTSNIYIEQCYINYNNGSQYFGPLYYTASDYYSTSRQNVSGWYLTSNTRIDSFDFGFTIGFFPPNFVYGNENDYRVGYENGYNEGYNVGNTTGYDTGYSTGNSEGYTQGFSVGSSQGYQEGYSAGVNTRNDYTFLTLFGAIADTPIMILRNLLGFEIFGVSAMSILMTMLTGSIALFIFRKVVL